MADQPLCEDPACPFNRRGRHFHRTFMLSSAQQRKSRRSTLVHQQGRRIQAIVDSQSESCDGYNCDFGRD